MNKLVSLLSMCKRAGYLTWGMDAVKVSVVNKEAKVLFVTQDIALNTNKKAQKLAKENQLPFVQLPVTKEELFEQLGNFVGILAVSNEGMRLQIEKLAGKE